MLWRWCVRIVVLIALTKNALADSAATQGAEPILLLGVTLDGNPNERLSDALAAMLRGRESLVSNRGLRHSERLCRDFACLIENADRRDAALIMSIDIRQQPGAGSHFTLHGQLFERRSRGGFTDTLICVQPDAAPCLEELAAQLLRKHKRPPARTPWTVPDDPLVGVRVDANASPRRRSLPAWRSATATGLGMLTALSLTAGIVLSLYHHSEGNEICDDVKSDMPLMFMPNRRCVWDFAVPAGLSYGLAGVSTAGIGVVLGVR